MEEKRNVPPPVYQPIPTTGYPYPDETQAPQLNLIVATQFGPECQQANCDFCGTTVQTRIVPRPTTKTHIIALLLCAFLCWPCVCVPYLCKSCQNIVHYCSVCNKMLGVYAS